MTDDEPYFKTMKEVEDYVESKGKKLTTLYLNEYGLLHLTCPCGNEVYYRIRKENCKYCKHNIGDKNYNDTVLGYLCDLEKDPFNNLHTGCCNKFEGVEE